MRLYCIFKNKYQEDFQSFLNTILIFSQYFDNLYFVSENNIFRIIQDYSFTFRELKQSYKKKPKISKKKLEKTQNKSKKKKQKISKEKTQKKSKKKTKTIDCSDEEFDAVLQALRVALNKFGGEIQENVHFSKRNDITFQKKI